MDSQKWANKIKEIALFKEKSRILSKSRKRQRTREFIPIFSKTKRAYQNKELSSEQIQLLNELNIEL